MSRRSEFFRDPGLTNKEFGVDLQETAQPLTIAGFQTLIAEMYSQKDAARGIDGTFMWLMEEVGELAGALRQGSREELAAEFADVLAWLVTIANVAEIDLEQAVLAKYGRGCPGCGQMVCRCDLGEKP
jgi:NTP pyrophosphatase (non-canonical NTP hydrolase)